MAALTGIVKKKQDYSKIDLTPMLDVVFILLIFFVVAAIQFDESSLALESQQPLPDQLLQEEMPQNILIEIQADNRIVFNGDRIDRGAVRARILQILAQNSHASVMVKPARTPLQKCLWK